MSLGHGGCGIGWILSLVLDSGGDSGWVYSDDAPVFEDVLSHAGLREGR